MEEKVADWESSMDEATLEAGEILDRLEKCLASGKAGAVERAGLFGELASVFERLERFAEGGRETAQGKAEMDLVEARIAAFESMRKLVEATFKEEAGYEWTWN